MKPSRLPWMLLVATASVLIATKALAASCPIDLTINTPKTDFTVAEPVIVRLTISNHSDSAIQFVEPLSGDFGRIGFWVLTKVASVEQTWAVRRGSISNRCDLRVVEVPPLGEVTREIDLSWMPVFSKVHPVEFRIRLEQDPSSRHDFPRDLLGCESESDPVWITLKLPRYDYDVAIAEDVLSHQSPNFEFFLNPRYEFNPEPDSEYRSWASLQRAIGAIHGQNFAGCLYHLELVEEEHLHQYLLERMLAAKAIALSRKGNIDEAEKTFSRLKRLSTQYARFGTLDKLCVNAAYDCSTSIFRPEWCNQR